MTHDELWTKFSDWPAFASRGNHFAAVRRLDRLETLAASTDLRCWKETRMSAAERLAALGLILPPPPAPLGNYVLSGWPATCCSCPASAPAARRVDDHRQGGRGHHVSSRRYDAAKM